MNGKSQSSDTRMRLQTVQPKFHLRIAGLFIVTVVVLGSVAYAKRGAYRAYYGGLSALAAIALFVQYSRERAIVQNRLSVVGVVTDYRMPLHTQSRMVNFVVSWFTPKIPRIKYSFVAFDQKTYTGETGWRAGGLYKGARITVLYNPENPAANHPLTGFIFYSFR